MIVRGLNSDRDRVASRVFDAILYQDVVDVCGQIKQQNASWTGSNAITRIMSKSFLAHAREPLGVCFSKCVQFLQKWGEDVFSSVSSARLEPLTQTV